VLPTSTTLPIGPCVFFSPPSAEVKIVKARCQVGILSFTDGVAYHPAHCGNRPSRHAFGLPCPSGGLQALISWKHPKGMYRSPVRSVAFAHAPILVARSGCAITSSFLGRPLFSQQQKCAALHSRVSRPRLLPVLASASADSAPNGAALPPNIPSDDTSTVAQRKRLSVVGIIFFIITYMWSILLFIPMAIIHPVVMWRDRTRRRLHDFITVCWIRCTFGSVMIFPKIVNKSNLPPKPTPAVFVANHSSALDIYAFAYLDRNIKFVSKAELFKLPVIGWAMGMSGHVALKRMSPRGQMEAFRNMVAVVRNGMSLVLFPEGTRSPTGKLRRFKAGAFRAAKQQNAPVVPVTILGTREVMPSHAWVPIRYPTGPISLVVHPAIDSTNRSIAELQDMAFEAIDSALPPEVQTRPPLKHK